MPWNVSKPMDEKTKFAAQILKGEDSFADVCRSFGVSRKTGYKWWGRYEVDGPGGLEEQSRAPHSVPHAMAPRIEAMLVDLRRRHPRWGPKKLVAWYERSEPASDWPAPSTVGDLLRRRCLSVPRRLRRRATPTGQPSGGAQEPNALWCADFKGWFRTGDGARCDPLTLSDAYSRYLLRCQALSGATACEQIQPLFEAAFREFGLPAAMRTDNGAPFASAGLAGLSRLSVWWLLLGIRLERSRPGHPQDNGRHERMHRTLDEETVQPPRATGRAQQRAFDRFQREFNEQRPHEALGQRTPASLYVASARLYPARLAEPQYRDDWERRRVRAGGQMKWRGRDVRISQALANQTVGLEPVADGQWVVHFTTLPLGLFDERAGRVRALPKALRQGARENQEETLKRNG